jgi:NAD(P)H dehydrogenase (quinone)
VIGITGATGGMGTRVASRVAARGLPLRLIVRDAARAPNVGAEVREASAYGARDEMRAALDGVDTLFLIPARESADRLEQHFAAVDAAVDAGVARIVYLGFIRRGDSSFTLGREHFATEDHIRASGIAWVFTRMNLYMDFVPNMIGSDGVIRGPAGEGRFAAVLRDDIADAVAAVLASPGAHEGQSYDLTGPEAFTLAEAAEEMSRAWGREIRFENETLEEAKASRAVYGAPDWEVEAWISSYLAIANGELSDVSADVERLADHPPTGLRDWLASEAGAAARPA